MTAERDRGQGAAAVRAPVIVAVVRDFGAEGHEIARMVSEELGIPFYDNELLVRVATREGLVVDEVAAFDERPGSPGAFLHDGTGLTRADQLFRATAQVILDLGSTRDCIIVGRLAEHVLRDNPNMFSVRVTAPFDERVRIVGRKRGMPTARAERLVRDRQREREAFYRRYSAGRCLMHDPKDLVVDRSVFGREGCCRIIAEAYRARLAAL